MTDYWHLALVFIAGILLGAGYFGALWWTVRTAITAQHPALLFVTSLLVRTGLVLTGFIC